MLNKKSIVAFIPGKTGSVGLPGKMFKKIGEYSLLEWTLLAATQSKYIDEIVVSAIDPLVFETLNKFALEHKEKVFRAVERPLELCSPTSKTEEAINHLFNNYPYYNDFDYIVMLQATSPIRKVSLIDDCIETIKNSDRESLLTVSSHTPFFFRLQNYHTDVLFDAKNRKMRQELTKNEMAYHDDGCLYCFKIPMFLREKCRFDQDPILYFNDKLSSMQIDDEIDFFLVKKIMEEFKTDTQYVHNTNVEQWNRL